jgi:hydroxymethylglutaryl-CoA lyase
MTARIDLVEVGPRDGFQSVVPFIPTDRKIDFIRRLHAAGFRRIEVGSFVSPKAVPQLSDIDKIIQCFGTMPSLRPSVLVPNERGAAHAASAGVREIVYVCSASDIHNQKNVRRSVEQSLEELERVVRNIAKPAGMRVRLNIGTAFDCPFTGRVPGSDVLRIAGRMLALDSATEICLCDTTGRATPRQVEQLFEQCLRRFESPETGWAFHGHDTYGLGLANVFAAFRTGITVFDGSVAGLGGCPFAPGATGNVASEDVVYLFSQMGLRTGIDLERLLAAADVAAMIPGASAGGRIRGLPMRENRPTL